MPMNKLRKIYTENNYYKTNTTTIWEYIPNIILFLVFITVITFSFIFMSVFSYYTVRNISMRPLLNNYTDPTIHDGVYVNTKNMGQVGDVIVLKNPEPDQNVSSVVKRLIATGGDKIAVVKTTEQNGIIEVYKILRIPKGNNTYYELVEQYIDQTSNVGQKNLYTKFNLLLSSSSQDRKETIGDITFYRLKDDEIFVLGDNRLNSRDSSSYGAVSKDNIIGKVEIIIKQEKFFFWQILQYMLGFKTV